MFLYVDDNEGFLFLTSAVVGKVVKEVLRLSSTISTTLDIRSILDGNN